MSKRIIYFVSTTIVIFTLVILVSVFFMLKKNNFGAVPKAREINPPKLVELGENPFAVNSGGGLEVLNDLKAGRRLIIQAMRLDKNYADKIDKNVYESNYGIYVSLSSKTADLDHTKYYLLNPVELRQAAENTKKLVERYSGGDNYGCSVNNKKDCYIPGDNLYPRKELAEAIKQRPLKYWQVENEWLWQIIDPETGKPASDEKLLNQFKIISQAIKEADPEAKIIMGAFASLNRPAALDGYNADGYIETGPVDCAYKNIFLEKATPDQLAAVREEKERVLFFLKEGAAYYDIVDFHSYNNNPVNFGLETEWLKRQLKKLGVKSKEIWSIENAGPFYFFPLLGLPKPAFCDPKDHFGIYDEKIQAEHLIKRYVIGFHNEVKKIFYSSLYPAEEWQSNFTRLSLINSEDNYKKPAYYTYKIMTENLSGFTSVEKIDNQDKNIFIYKFTAGDKSVFTAWSESGEKIIDLSSYLNKQTVKITYIITELDDRKQPVYLPDETLSAKSVKINGSPVFIR